LRNAYFGDLHVHTALSFDAYSDDVRTGPADAYAFAKGQPIALPPLDANGHGTQTLQLAKPLDFAAVTDHSEFLGEVATCITPGSASYDSPSCVQYRAGGQGATTMFGLALAAPDPMRRADICDGTECPAEARDVWQRIQEAAENAYDRTAACSFTSLIAYEWTGATGVSNLHRNVIFRDDRVPDKPVTYFDAPTAAELWQKLDSECKGKLPGCSVLAIPHNSNLSNGKMFIPAYPGATSLDDERAQAALRGSMEPLLEIFQHKGTSECMNGLSGILGAPDELCNIEQVRLGSPDCGDTTGSLGMIGQGCVSRYDFARGAWLAGLAEEERLGVNPYRLGVVASTDTHMATPGATNEADFRGHTGAESTIETRLGDATIPAALQGNPGGLAGVWAVENSRHAIFDALLRRETFGTSGPRIVPRFFGGWAYPANLCADAKMIDSADQNGVPMGAVLPERPPGAGGPVFVVAAERDPSAGAAELQHVQIIKGWIGTDGTERHEQIYEVAGDPNNGAGVDETTCERTGTGSDSLCAVFTDPDFDPARPAFYYMRVVENPSCRWSHRQCLSLPVANRPAACTDPDQPRIIQEMAWTSPIWFAPPSP
jgi:hypothetical protein